MRLFNKVAVIGVGLIGGSIALGLKKKKLAQEIIGVSRHKNTLLLAKKSGAIDKGSQQLSIIQGADLVILAAPVHTILDLAEKISQIIPKDCLVTDVGSTKAKITSKLSEVFPNYVGSHPLAGSEKRGITHAQAGIFKGSLCVLTPLKNTKPEAIKKIKALWSRLGARVILLNPRTHDKILSFVSHLPHVIAFSLISAIPDKYLMFGASGLKDTTRISLSDSQLWLDILLSNKKNVLESIRSFQNNLLKIESAIKRNDINALRKILQNAKKKRERLSHLSGGNSHLTGGKG